jgi:hypothetical protein
MLNGVADETVDWPPIEPNKARKEISNLTDKTTT